MTLRYPVALAMLAALSLGGCGGAAHSPPSAPAAPDGPADRLESLMALDRRIARVAFRLSADNFELCPDQRRSAGWALHAANLYSRELRPFAQERFGLDGDLPGVLTAPEGSAAARAGVRAGDLIVAVEYTDLTLGRTGAEPLYDGFAANVARVDAALAKGPTDLRIRRRGETVTLTVTPEAACGYEVQLNPSDDLNARADGRRLFISTALAGFAETDDELAVILGHELAHHVLGHREWDDAGGAGRSRNAEAAEVEGGPGGKERQADRVGLYLMARAGYDPAVAAPFWRRFGASNWRVRYPQLEHASADTRARRLDEVRAEIEAKRAAGQPLLP